jgi:hypothetical protein
LYRYSQGVFAMVIVWGTTHAGKVDEVPGMFHVVTQFGHLYYIPLIPTGSYVVLEKMSDGGFRGASIGISFKSWLVAWLRAGCIVAMIAAAIMGVVAIAEAQKNPFGWVLPVVMAVAAIAVLILSYKLKFITHASYQRAVELGQHAGLTDMGMLMIEVAYGRMSPEQADAQLAKLDQQVFEAQLADQGNSVV